MKNKKYFIQLNQFIFLSKIMKTPYIWKNGEFIAWDDALDHNITHSLHYGSWVFEWIRFYPTEDGPKIFRLKEHIQRLFYSASCMQMEIPFTEEEIINATIELVEKSGVESGYIRPIAYFGYGKMWLNPTWAPVEVAISAWAWWKYLSEDPINVKIPSIRRIDPQTIPMGAKICGNYANSILASLEIKNGGYDEWLLLDTQWFIAEWPGENVFFVRWKKVYTPTLWTILPWITRNTIIKLFKDKFDIDVKETRINPKQLWDFDEAFFVWTAAEVTPIWTITDEFLNKIEYDSWDKNSYTQKIKKIYDDVVKWKDKDYLDWLA